MPARCPETKILALEDDLLKNWIRLTVAGQVSSLGRPLRGLWVPSPGKH